MSNARDALARVRGIRNNNPGNIRLGAQRWQGQVADDEQGDQSFVQFVNPIAGLRALVRVLDTYRAQV